ncbi:hypothetical protein EVG20_g7926 [Dentipellis fragilis]|uniref:Uncharacterized protein n=1 Tax=Dentipellis fragilis TaxID=205917 RepID=A0A4Y9Y980_9AGAM|nr:hypothetical protein EVG20_g7926 [Dentipellis fragilis]
MPPIVASGVQKTRPHSMLCPDLRSILEAFIVDVHFRQPPPTLYKQALLRTSPPALRIGWEQKMAPTPTETKRIPASPSPASSTSTLPAATPPDISIPKPLSPLALVARTLPSQTTTDGGMKRLPSNAIAAKNSVPFPRPGNSDTALTGIPREALSVLFAKLQIASPAPATGQTIPRHLWDNALAGAKTASPAPWGQSAQSAGVNFTNPWANNGSSAPSSALSFQKKVRQVIESNQARDERQWAEFAPGLYVGFTTPDLPPPSFLWLDGPKWSGEWKTREITHTIELAFTGPRPYGPIESGTDTKLQAERLRLEVPPRMRIPGDHVQLTLEQLCAARQFVLDALPDPPEEGETSGKEEKSGDRREPAVFIACAQGLQKEAVAIAVCFLASVVAEHATSVARVIDGNHEIGREWKRLLSHRDLVWLEAVARSTRV